MHAKRTPAELRASLVAYVFVAHLLGLVVYVLFLIATALIEAYFVSVVAEKCSKTAPALVRAYIDQQEASALEAQCRVEWLSQVQERTR